MSRIGKMPIQLPAGVTVTSVGKEVTVKGERGELKRVLPDGVSVELMDNRVVIARDSEERRHRAMHGLARALVANMVDGVSKGFSKELELSGVGFRGQMAGSNLVLSVGFSHKVEFSPPAGVSVAITGAKIRVEGSDKQLVGAVAAKIRRIHPPDHYKGKGIRYAGEKLRLKPGKAGKVAAK
ncbi:MAG: 50S ribosomal protein L6 [Chloroflexota bacterium]